MCNPPNILGAGSATLDSAIRLVGGTQRSGRLETLQGGQWVGVAVYNVSGQQSVAAQACRILGMVASSAPAVVEASDAFGAPTVQRWINFTYCSGSENALSDCRCYHSFSDAYCIASDWYSGRTLINGTTSVPASAQMAITCPEPERACFCSAARMLLRARVRACVN